MRTGSWTMVEGVLLAAVLEALFVPAPAVAARRLPLVPYPQAVRVASGAVDLTRDWCVAFDSSDSSDALAARELVGEARARGWPWRLGVGAGKPRVLIARRPPRAGETPLAIEQGYGLAASSERIEIRAPQACGRFYGVQTLRQLVRGTDGHVPALRIRDAPTLAIRGVSDDVSRGQMSTTADFGAIVRRLAYYKMNVYQLYLESAFRFRVPAGARTPMLEPGELAAITAEAARHHVRVVPIVEALSHQNALLADPANRALSESAQPATFSWWSAMRRAWNGGDEPLADDADDFGRSASAGGATFCATDPAARRMVIAMLDDVGAVTRDLWVHVGGDECDAIALGRSRDAVRSLGFGAVYAEWFGALRAHLARSGRRTMLYADMALRRPDVLERLSRDLVLVDWHYDPLDTFATLGRLRSAGFDSVIASPALWNWRSFHSHWARALPNIAHAADAARREHALGCIVASWTDGGTETLRSLNWPGYAYTAAACWESHAPEPAALLRADAVQRYGVNAAQLAAVETMLADLAPPPQGWWGRAFHARLSFHARTPRWMGVVHDLQGKMTVACRALDRLAPHPRATSDAALLRHSVERFRYLAEREIALDRIGRRLASRPGVPEEASARELRALAGRLRTLRADYARLWLATNRVGTLPMLEKRLEREQGELQAAATEAARGTLTCADPVVTDLGR